LSLAHERNGKGLLNIAHKVNHAGFGKPLKKIAGGVKWERNSWSMIRRNRNLQCHSLRVSYPCSRFGILYIDTFPRWEYPRHESYQS